MCPVPFASLPPEATNTSGNVWKGDGNVRPANGHPAASKSPAKNNDTLPLYEWHPLANGKSLFDGLIVASMASIGKRPDTRRETNHPGVA